MNHNGFCLWLTVKIDVSVFPTSGFYIKKNCCKQHYWDCIGSHLNGKILISLTILGFVVIPSSCLPLYMQPFDGVNIFLRTHLQVNLSPLSLVNAKHAPFLLSVLALLYAVGTIWILAIFTALYSGLSCQFWLRFGFYNLFNRYQHSHPCKMHKFRFSHYQQLRLLAGIFNQAYGHPGMTCT